MSDYLKYVEDCSSKGEEPLTGQQYDFASKLHEWYWFDLEGKCTKEQALAKYTKCIREEPFSNGCLSYARLKIEGELLPWWEQPPGFREGKIEEPPKSFISSIYDIEYKLDYPGQILVTKDVLRKILNKLLKIKRESVIEDGIEYYVLNNYELDCYTELLT